MLRREINHRPKYTKTQNEVGLNITSNYYPVVTAIAIQDPKSNMQLVVMNDRAQGGSVILDGRIELMQNRRLITNDGIGEDEILNEVNQQGEGVAV